MPQKIKFKKQYKPIKQPYRIKRITASYTAMNTAASVRM
jgi:hypothetical protein